MISYDLSLQELLALIDMYFDCRLSDAEEAQLRAVISRTRYVHPAIDEVRAIMGFRNVRCAEPSRPSFSRGWIAAAAAAVVICALAINIVFFTDTPPSAGYECFAYANGQRVTDEDEVMKMLTADLKEFSRAAEDIDNDFSAEISDIASIIEVYEYPMPK